MSPELRWLAKASSSAMLRGLLGEFLMLLTKTSLTDCGVASPEEEDGTAVMVVSPVDLFRFKGMSGEVVTAFCLINMTCCL